MACVRGSIRSKFQFTHPGRGATLSVPKASSLILSFNSRTPGGVRPRISISSSSGLSFNSRTPGGVRLDDTVAIGVGGVSIHAPREGCDIS